MGAGSEGADGVCILFLGEGASSRSRRGVVVVGADFMFILLFGLFLDDGLGTHEERFGGIMGCMICIDGLDWALHRLKNTPIEQALQR